jgi:Mn2+/Fe2+ NRAMP family transporter
MQITSALFRLAVSCWVGGASLFTFVLTPIIFKSYNRDMAGGIVGVLFPGYFKWGLVCGVIALITIFFSTSKYKTIAAVIIAVMLTITVVQAFVLEPRAAALKEEIPSFETTPKDHPLRVQFRKLHGVSAAGNLVVIGGGVALILLL